MNTTFRLTAFCGLYCTDCIPYDRAFYTTAKQFAAQLERVKFRQYAPLRAGQFPALADFPRFEAALQAIRDTQCNAICREGGCKKNCEIRACAIDRQLPGCWECPDRPSCSLLDGLRKSHPHLDQNLDLIREKGVENWAAERKPHYGF